MACDTSIRCGSTRQSMSACCTILVYGASIHEAVSYMLVVMVIWFPVFSLGDV